MARGRLGWHPSWQRHRSGTGPSSPATAPSWAGGGGRPGITSWAQLLLCSSSGLPGGASQPLPPPKKRLGPDGEAEVLLEARGARTWEARLPPADRTRLLCLAPCSSVGWGVWGGPRIRNTHPVTRGWGRADAKRAAPSQQPPARPREPGVSLGAERPRAERTGWGGGRGRQGTERGRESNLT